MRTCSDHEHVESDQGGPGPGFGCISQNNSRPIGSPSTNFDARVYNLFTLTNLGAIVTYDRGAVARLQFASYYRGVQHACRSVDATTAMGCFAANDSCSIGYTNYGAVEANPTIQATALDGEGALIAGAPNAGYPMRRPLFICQLEDSPAPVVGEDLFITYQRAIYDDLRGNDPNGFIADAIDFAGGALGDAAAAVGAVAVERRRADAAHPGLGDAVGLGEQLGRSHSRWRREPSGS